MATDINSLIYPEAITVELVLLIGVLLVMMLYASLKLRSMFGMFGFLLMIVSLVIALLTNVSLIWFWIVVMIEAVILVLAEMAYTRAQMRAKS